MISCIKICMIIKNDEVACVEVEQYAFENVSDFLHPLITFAILSLF